MQQTLLDTDTITLFHKRHPVVRQYAGRHVRQFGHLLLPEFSYYEYSRGLKAIRASAQLARFEQFCQSHRIVPFSHDASVIAADLWADLRQRGLMIGEVDILIASIAISEGLAVATHNLSHFHRIPNLQLVDWTI